MTEEIEITVCENCVMIREASENKCPHCGRIEKMDFDEWFEQSDEDPEYISISRIAWYAGQENK